MKFQTVRYVIPAHFASYLINGDSSGIEEKELKEFDSWYFKQGFNKQAHHWDIKGDSYFSSTNDMGDSHPLGGDVVDAILNVGGNMENETKRKVRLNNVDVVDSFWFTQLSNKIYNIDQSIEELKTGKIAPDTFVKRVKELVKHFDLEQIF